MESETKLEVVRIDMECDQCRNGVIRHDKSMGILVSNPPQYPHKCTIVGIEKITAIIILRLNIKKLLERR